jgi:hypothetical protein
MELSKYQEVLQTLKSATEEKRIIWEDLPDEEMFRTLIAGGLVRIGKFKRGGETGYSLTITNKLGAIIAELEFLPKDNDYKLIEEVYNSARFNAGDGEQMIDSIIAQGKQLAKRK